MEEFLKTLDLVPFDLVMIAACVPLVILLWKSMERYLFAPYLAVVEAREQLTSGAIESAAQSVARAHELEVQYQNVISAARVSAVKEKSERLLRAKAEAAHVVSKAEDEAQEHLRSVRWELAQKIESLKSSAFKESDVIAGALFQKITAPQQQPAVKGKAAH